MTAPLADQVRAMVEAFKPFVDLKYQSGAWGLISKELDGMQPLNITVTKAQMRAAALALASIDLDQIIAAVESFKIGDTVEIVPETAGMGWAGEPCHFVTGVDWHPKHGVTYTTSEVWPPKTEGWHICGLTDEWQPEHLRLALRQQEQKP